MRNIRLTVAYDGTHFIGWQRQSRGRSIQQELEWAAEKLLGQPLAMVGAGRTDSGVHADGQVANFRTENESIPDERFREALNAHLPPDVRVLASCSVAADFHARFDARRRTYRYRFATADVAQPRWRNYCYFVRRIPTIAHLNQMAALLIGEHDFATFAMSSANNARETARSAVRRIYNAAFYPRTGFVLFQITANGFLRRMVRSIVGTMLELTSAADFEARLAARDRRYAGSTAPPQGLCLHRVLYEEGAEIRRELECARG